MISDKVIDRFAARLQTAGYLIARIEEAPWIDDFESRLGQRLPPCFSSLMRRYAFAPFEWGRVRFFGNSGTNDDGDFVIAAMRDPAIWQATIRAGFIQFARSPGGNYDLICFDTTIRRKNRGTPIVRIDHEAILIYGRVVVVEDLWPSFGDLLESLLADGESPDAA